MYNNRTRNIAGHNLCDNQSEASILLLTYQIYLSWKTKKESEEEEDASDWLS